MTGNKSDRMNSSSFSDELATPKKWVSDAEVAVCQLCLSTEFGYFTRKHHCRNCGRCVCASCSTNKMAMRMPSDESSNSSFLLSPFSSSTSKPTLQRVCDGCYEVKSPESRNQSQSDKPERTKHEGAVKSPLGAEGGDAESKTWNDVGSDSDGDEDNESGEQDTPDKVKAQDNPQKPTLHMNASVASTDSVWEKAQRIERDEALQRSADLSAAHTQAVAVQALLAQEQAETEAEVQRAIAHTMAVEEEKKLDDAEAERKFQEQCQADEERRKDEERLIKAAHTAAALEKEQAKAKAQEEKVAEEARRASAARSADFARIAEEARQRKEAEVERKAAEMAAEVARKETDKEAIYAAAAARKQAQEAAAEAVSTAPEPTAEELAQLQADKEEEALKFAALKRLREQAKADAILHAQQEAEAEEKKEQEKLEKEALAREKRMQGEAMQARQSAKAFEKALVAKKRASIHSRCSPSTLMCWGKSAMYVTALLPLAHMLQLLLESWLAANRDVPLAASLAAASEAVFASSAMQLLCQLLRRAVCIALSLLGHSVLTVLFLWVFLCGTLESALAALSSSHLCSFNSDYTSTAVHLLRTQLRTHLSVYQHLGLQGTAAHAVQVQNWKQNGLMAMLPMHAYEGLGTLATFAFAVYLVGLVVLLLPRRGKVASPSLQA